MSRGGRFPEKFGIDCKIARMPRLVLLGDYIFDNAQYTGGGPDVVSQVRSLATVSMGRITTSRRWVYDCEHS